MSTYPTTLQITNVLPTASSAGRLHSKYCVLLADRTNGRAYATVLRLSVVCRLSVTLCIVAKRCVLSKSYYWEPIGSRMRNRLVPKWMTLSPWPFFRGHVNRCVTFDVEYLGNR